MPSDRSRHIVLSALFITLGLVLPMLFHGLGLGRFFLPMFWPVAASGFFLTAPFCLAVGILTPWVSFLLTG